MKSSLLLAFTCLTLLTIALVALPGGSALAQKSADVILEQRIQDALANAGFDPGPADGKFGPKTRKAIQAWQRANGHRETGYLTREQVRSILTKVPPTVTLEPKCAELPGQYLGENHAECWGEIQNQTGCYLWRTHYHSDQATQWTGQCRRGVAEGHGTYSVSPGSEHHSYEGSGLLVNGKANGRWVEEVGDGNHYEGEYLDGNRTGIWILKWANGNRYEGEFHAGERTGRGVYTWANGNRYEGEFHAGERTGRGVYTWASGDRYEGDFVEGERAGYGIYIWPNGDRYEGDFVEGERTGYGIYIWPNGDRYEGEFRGDEEHGFGTLTVPNLYHYEGEFRSALANGFGSYVDTDGVRVEGQWHDGCCDDCLGADGEYYEVFFRTSAAACGFEFKTSPDVVPDYDFGRP